MAVYAGLNLYKWNDCSNNWNFIIIHNEIALKVGTRIIISAIWLKLQDTSLQYTIFVSSTLPSRYSNIPTYIIYIYNFLVFELKHKLNGKGNSSFGLLKLIAICTYVYRSAKYVLRNYVYNP